MQHSCECPNLQGLTAEKIQEHMSALAAVLESFECLIAGKIGNFNLTQEDYAQIDPEEMELMDIKWCMASVIRRAQRFKEITGRNVMDKVDSKLGFDKSKVRCFKCKEKGHFKRECTNKEVKIHLGEIFINRLYFIEIREFQTLSTMLLKVPGRNKQKIQHQRKRVL